MSTPNTKHPIKKTVKFLWNELGQPTVWVVLMLTVLILETLNGVSLIGTFWMTVFILAYFLSRIACAVEKIADTKQGQ